MRSASKTTVRKSGSVATRNANTEVEIKLRIHDLPRVLRQLARHKAKLMHARVREMNTLYDTPEAHLARHGRMLRLRVEYPAGHGNGRLKARKRGDGKRPSSALLTFKGPAKGTKANERGRYKVREEHELRISDYQGLPKILQALGLRPWFRYEKFRTIFKLPGLNRLKLMLDETPIGMFVELEGESRQIDRATELLGFARPDYITKSYGALFLEQRGLSGRASRNEPIPFSGVPDMVFPRNRRPAGRGRADLGRKIRSLAAP
jgi:adenylate cyclase, class 2